MVCSRSPPLEAMACRTSLSGRWKRLTIPLVCGVHRGREAVLDAKFGAEQVKLVLAGGSSFAQAEQAVGESLLLSVSTRVIFIGAARLSRRKRRALVAVCAG